MNGDEKMKTTQKKLVGGLLVGLLVVTVGAAFATGSTDDITDDAMDKEPPQMPFGKRHGMFGLGLFASELTDEQQTELKELMRSLREQNTSPDEIRTAIQEKLDEWGVLDTQLDDEIAQTEQRLIILNKQKELRAEGYSWDEINSIIEDEFDLENTTGFSCNIMGGLGCGHGPCRDPQDIMAGEDLDQ